MTTTTKLLLIIIVDKSVRQVALDAWFPPNALVSRGHNSHCYNNSYH